MKISTNAYFILKHRHPWVVNILGKANDSFEISVVRDSYTHGKRSFGWHGKMKRVVASDGGPCNKYVDQWIFDRLTKLAYEYADKLNQEEDVIEVDATKPMKQLTN